MSKPVLSIGMIMKNEIRCLERCLQSLQSLREAVSCQLVIADTGSTDGSRAVAEQYADEVFDFPWVGDFSAARNAVLERCTGEWIFTIDADEWLDSDIDELLLFLRKKERDHFDMGSVIQRNYQDKYLRAYGDFFAMRLGRRRNGQLCYKGAIHEYLTYQDRNPERSIILNHTILHHDGYIEVTPGHIKEKQRRNMALLREEVARRPEDLRTLGQCIDSAEDKKEKRKYTDQAMEILRTTTEAPLVFQAAAFQKCMQVYYEAKENELVRECYQCWKEHYPESALLRVDGEAITAAAEYRANQYEEALEHITNYRRALDEVAKGEDLQRDDRMYSQYDTDNLRWRSNLEMIRFHCLCTLERYDEADELLRQVDLKQLTLVDLGVIVIKLLSKSEQLSQSADFLARCWDYYRDDAYWNEQGQSGDQQKITEDFQQMLQGFAKDKGEAGLSLLAQLGGRAPGQSARIMLAEDGTRAAAEWAQVRELQWIFPQAYLHTMELGAPLPERVYRQTSETLAALAASMARQEEYPRTVAAWLTQAPPPETPGELLLDLDLVTAALRSQDWWEEEPLGRALCALYLDLSCAYLDNFYPPELLNQEDLNVLPGMARFSWYCRQAQEALQAGDELGYVRALRAGLDTAPAMKKTVEFLMEHPPRKAPTPELLALAEQVRSILKQYAPDDPAVAALKASPAYQQVAYLLEEHDL